MERFIELFEKIDGTKSTVQKVNYVTQYFLNVPFSDAAWALFFLSGNKLKRIVGSSQLFEWCLEESKLPAWILSESYAHIGDVAETISLIIAKRNQLSKNSTSLSQWIERDILPMKNLSTDQKKAKILNLWRKLNSKEIFILNKLLTGSFRIGMSELLTIQALSQAFNISKELLSQRLMGQWKPTTEFFENLIAQKHSNLISNLNPYPFFLASPLVSSLEELGDIQEWQAEWKWDGIRAQGIKREGKTILWSRGNELISNQFPEILESLDKLENGVVIDGEILAYQKGRPLPFGELQKRLGRKKVSKEIINSVPISFIIYDLLEYQNKDIRNLSLTERREIFEKWDHLDERMMISPLIKFQSWEDLKNIREEAYSNATEGIILKNKNSKYGTGRRRGSWWKFKIEPRKIDAILIYAQPGQGWRANLYTDYTFGVWKDKELVPIAKAYSGLSQEEIYELDKWIRKNTEEKFGPVRKVKPLQVFELAFEGVQKSSRHKSGIAFRFPRISRWRKDKPASECDNLESIKDQFIKEI